MLHALYKLKDRLFGLHYEFPASDSFRAARPGCHTVIVQGSFAADQWRVASAVREIECYPESACCGLDSFVTSRTTGHMETAAGEKHFTNAELIKLLREAYPDLLKLHEGDKIHLNAFFAMARICVPELMVGA